MGKDKVEDFIAVTGSNELTAKQMLEAFSGNLEAAVSSYLDCPIPPSKPTSSTTGEPEVRAPIPQTKGVLVDDIDANPQWMVRNRPRSVFDGFRNFKAEEVDNITPGSKKLKRLEDLFRPPLDIMHKGTFLTAKAEGSLLHKWLMVNVQNVREFACQVLNRDVWSDSRVKALVKENFIFWQVYSDSSEGERFMTFYKVSDWPNVSILDPRTGGRLAVLKDFSKEAVISQLLDFVDNHGSLAAEEVQPPTKKRKIENEEIWDTSEDAQMAAAIAASLRESVDQPPTPDDSSQSDDNDDDDLERNGDDDDCFEIDQISVVEKSRAFKRSANGKRKNAGTSDSSADEKGCNGQDKSAPGSVRQDASPSSPPRKKLVKIFPKRSPSVSGKDSRTTHYDPLQRFSGAPPARDGFGQSEAPPTTARDRVVNQSAAPGKKCCLMLRLPDGAREKLVMQDNDTIGDLHHFLTLKKLGADKIEFLTNFPQRILSNLDHSTTLREAGLCPQETVFVRELL